MQNNNNESKDLKLKIGKKSDCVFNDVINNRAVIAGPCSVEDIHSLELVAQSIKKMGLGYIRGGTFKARTSPYSFEGLKKEGLKILKYVSKKYDLKSVSEIVDPRHVELMIDYVDILQIGARNMHNFELLKEVGRSRYPVILKRGFGATIEEFMLSAEYIAIQGNRNIVMCERGIRTFENATRNTLDISCIAIIKSETKLSIIADLSHSLGKRKDIIESMTKAVIAAGADGVMLEVHPTPETAISDKDQQLTITEFENLINHTSAPL